MSLNTDKYGRHKEFPGTREVKLKEAGKYYEKKELDKAKKIALVLLEENPDDYMALLILSNIEADSGHSGLAVNLAKRGIDLNPNETRLWNLAGYNLHRLFYLDAAIEYLQKSLEVAPANVSAMINLASVYISKAKPDIAERYARMALEKEPDSVAATDNLALALLGQGKWAEGWDRYEGALGVKFRKEWTYGDKGRWDGSKGHCVVFSGEQGLGDELLFCSGIPQAIKDCSHVIVDCDPRLEGLFKRSFPKAEIVGARWDKAPIFSRQPDYRCSMGTIPKFYFRDEKDIKGGKFLDACFSRKLMYRGLLESMPGPRIGVAWTGGTKMTDRDARCLDPKQLKPLTDLGGSWISLEYISPDLKGMPIKHYPYAVETEDYDDTAALVDELDLIISVPTTVVHLAGALGKECWCLVPERPNWRFGLTGDRMPWHDSVRLIRQAPGEPWASVIQRVREDLRAYIHRNGQSESGIRHGADVVDITPSVKTNSPDPVVFGAFHT